MIYEMARIDVTPGSEAAFEAAVGEARPLFEGARGYRSLHLHRVIEAPSQYLLVVGWETVEDHTVHFRGSDAFARWRELAGPHFAGTPQVQHTRVTAS